MKKILFLALLLQTLVSYSQTANFNDAGPNKGKMFAYWGWNRGHFSTSDITFKGENYNFTLDNVEAKDKPNRLVYIILK